MRRLISIICLLVLLCGCQQSNPVNNLVGRLKQEEKTTESQYLNLDFQVTQLGEEVYRYHVKINQPQANLDNVKALLYCETQVGSTLPTIGFYENDKCNLYLDKIDADKHYYEGISLMGISNVPIEECYLYCAYEVNGVLVEEYIILGE